MGYPEGFTPQEYAPVEVVERPLSASVAQQAARQARRNAWEDMEATTQPLAVSELGSMVAKRVLAESGAN